MKSILSHSRPVIVCEFVGEDSLRGGKALLEGAGYSVKELKRTFFGFPVKELKTTSAVRDGPEFWADMLAIPSEKETSWGTCGNQPLGTAAPHES